MKRTIGSFLVLAIVAGGLVLGGGPGQAAIPPKSSGLPTVQFLNAAGQFVVSPAAFTFNVGIQSDGTLAIPTAQIFTVQAPRGATWWAGGLPSWISMTPANGVGPTTVSLSVVSARLSELLSQFGPNTSYVGEIDFSLGTATTGVKLSLRLILAPVHSGDGSGSGSQPTAPAWPDIPSSAPVHLTA